MLDPTGLALVTGQQQAKKRGGSVFGCKYIDRKRSEADDRLGVDYFNANSVYDDHAFRRA